MFRAIHHCLQIYLRTFEICLEIYELDPFRFLIVPSLAWQAALKKNKVKLDKSTDINMLLMVEEGIRGGMCHSIYRYAKGNNKCMKDYNKNEDGYIFNIGM